MRKIKKGDNVIIISGKDKGKIGSVIKFDNADRVIVQGINTVKKHEKPNPNKGITGGIIEKEAYLHISNIAIYNYSTKKADKISIEVDHNNLKNRVFKSTGEKVEI